MNYQLVALFERGNHYNLKDIQRTVCKKLNLFKPVPVLNIPICTFIDVDLDVAEELVCKVLAPYKHFKIKINNSMAISKDNKVHIQIDKCGYISTIQRNVQEYAGLQSIKMSNKHPNLVIPIATGNYNFKKILQKNKHVSVNRSLPKDQIIGYGKIVKFELWRTSGPRRDNVMMTIPLREF